MTTIREVLKAKPAALWFVSPGATVFEALELMADEDIGAVLVMDDEAVVGVFSERDYARNVILKGRSSKSTPVAALMSTPVLYVRLEQTLSDCMALMTAKRVRHLPVLDGDRLAGIVTIGDIVKQIISKQSFEIEQLVNYIRGAN